jgi:hypothetical protein
MKRASRAGLLAAGAAWVLACGGGGPAQRDPDSAAAPDEGAAAPAAEPERVLIEPAAEGEIDVRFGLGLAADGAITTPVLSFGAGDPICLSITLPTGGAGSTLALRWFDVSGALVGETTAALTGARPRAALRLPGGERLPRGDYRIELEVDGRESGEATFSISDLRQTERAGGA